MPSTYSEADTERARQAERAASGLPAQPYGAMPIEQPAQLPADNQRSNVLSLLLILVGGLLLFRQLPGYELEIIPGGILLTIASCFLFFALWKRIYGLLIPGCILSGLGLGVIFVNLSDGISILWGLALGFLAILFAGRLWFHARSSWPIYPAVPLFAVGVIIALANAPGLFSIVLLGLPLLLIGAGMYLGLQHQHA